MNTFELTKKIIRRCLQLSESTQLDEDTYLIGNFPEFNSLTITTIIGDIEEELDVDVDDDEIEAEIFETVGSLAAFVQEKYASA